MVRGSGSNPEAGNPRRATQKKGHVRSLASQSAQVWDLPQAPEDNACPEERIGREGLGFLCVFGTRFGVGVKAKTREAALF